VGRQSARRRPRPPSARTYHAGAICAVLARDLISISIPRAASAFDISAELPFAERAAV
jgi:hypothetical protein